MFDRCFRRRDILGPPEHQPRGLAAVHQVVCGCGGAWPGHERAQLPSEAGLIEACALEYSAQLRDIGHNRTAPLGVEGCELRGEELLQVQVAELA